MRTQTSKGEERLSAQFDHKAIESKWRKIWEERTLYQPDIKRSKNSFCNLMMFPYPSALGLHVGNIYAFVGSDIYGRFKRMQGFDVFEPIGLDGFGIHSENFALKVGKHPMELSKTTEKNIYAQLRSIGNGFDWPHKLETYTSDYYKWTQWIFTQLFKRGLAYRAEANVNWCPSCKTVLADEQVVNKSKVESRKSKVEETAQVCERCGAEVEKRKLEQWFFRITNYAQRLLSGLEKIDWSEKVKVAQRNWLGKSEGLLLKFKSDIESNSQVEVFTTRPDTLYGVTFMALAPEHPQVTKILDKSKGLLKRQIQKYVADSLKKPESQRISPVDGGKQKDAELVKTGIKTGFHCTNPATGDKIPIFIADYVLMSYGTGAVMGVPAHDQRDYLFAKKYQIDIVEVIRPAGPVSLGTRGPVGSSSRSTSSAVSKSLGDQNQTVSLRALSGTPSAAATPRPERSRRVSQAAFTDYGALVNSGQFSGLESQEAIEAISNFAIQKGFGKKKVMWHLRDWLISRQRYWGAPIPMIFCAKCAKDGKSWFTKELESTTGYTDTTSTTRVKKARDTRGTLDTRDTSWAAGWYPVPESDLPVELPYIKNFKPSGMGVSPLAQDPNFVKVKCPECGSEARRETDVSDTFLDSAWYFLRYPSVNERNSKHEARNTKQIQNSQIRNSKSFGFRIARFERVPTSRKADFDIPWDRQITRRWLPVDMYIGGAEHSVLHLLYSRFLTMAFYDMDLVDFTEPFSKFRAHGLLIKEGAKMSKSKGNVVLPDPYIAKYGADTLRTYLMFCGRFDQGGDFRDTGIEGMHRFLRRVWRLVVTSTTGSQGTTSTTRIRKTRDTRDAGDTLYVMHKTIKKVSEDIENLRYNTAISAIMEWVGTLEKRAVESGKWKVESGQKGLYTHHSRLQAPERSDGGQASLITEEEVKNLLLLLAPFAPYMAEELWQRVSGKWKVESGKFKLSTFNSQLSIHLHSWPKYDEKTATSPKIELVIQVNGRVRDRIIVDREIAKEAAQKLALKQKNTQKHLGGKTPQKVIFVKGRLINFVV